MAGGLNLGHTLTRLIADQQTTDREWRRSVIANLAPAAVWINMGDLYIPDHITLLCALLGFALAIGPIRDRQRKALAAGTRV